MYFLYPAGLQNLSYQSNCNPRQHLMQHQKIYFYILIVVLFTPNSVLQSSKNSIPRCISRSNINIKWREREDFGSVTFVLATIVGSKNKSIYLRDFKDVDFNFTHFANFKFAYFEIEVSFGLIWVNLQNGRFHLQISILGT